MHLNVPLLFLWTWLLPTVSTGDMNRSNFKWIAQSELSFIRLVTWLGGNPAASPVTLRDCCWRKIIVTRLVNIWRHWLTPDNGPTISPCSDEPPKHGQLKEFGALFDFSRASPGIMRVLSREKREMQTDAWIIEPNSLWCRARNMNICAGGVAYLQTVWLLTGVGFSLNARNLNAVELEYRLLFISTA